MIILYICLNYVVWTTQTVLALDIDVSPRRDLPFLDLAKYDGYEAEQHFVTTDDGYILGVFRIPLQNKKCTKSKGVILFMHGLYLSSDDCLVPGPGTAHCYIYSDNCYEVWAPNVRGNVYSRNHTTYNPDTDSKFWDFSVDEMAKYDLPVVIDYILEKTHKTKLTFVGHSQGVTLLVLLCANDPGYNDKIKVGVGLSATAWLEHARFLVIHFQGLIDPLVTALHGKRDVEILSRNGPTHDIIKLVCGVTELSYPVCSTILFLLLGFNKYQITPEVFPVMVGHIPSGTSLKNFVRWGQMKNNGFAKFDYGPIENIARYGQVKPPLFDLSKVTMKWIMIGSHNDYVGDLRDVQTLVTNLPNAELCVVADKTFAHLDFIFGKDIPKYLTPVVLSYTEKQTYECIGDIISADDDTPAGSDEN